MTEISIEEHLLSIARVGVTLLREKPCGSSATDSLAISSVSGFSGIVNFTATVSPMIGNGPTANLNPSKVTLTSGKQPQTHYYL